MPTLENIIGPVEERTDQELIKSISLEFEKTYPAPVHLLFPTDYDQRGFRTLNEKEEEILNGLFNKAFSRGFRNLPFRDAPSLTVAVKYTKDGNFTNCLLVAKIKRLSAYGYFEGKEVTYTVTGSSKRNPIDRPNRYMGEIKAFVRAVNNLINDIKSHSYLYP